MPALVMFSKMVQDLPLPKAAEAIKGLNFDGIDLTVRPAGYVLPENVVKGLPEALKVVRSAGLSVPMITTGITKIDDPHAESIVATAASLGIRYLKLGYWMSAKGKLAESIESARKALDRLERLAETHHVTLGVHNHSGNGYVNCQPLVILDLLKGRNPNHVASYFDPGHAAVEGGAGGWRQSLELLGPQIRMLAVKDFGWTSTPGKHKSWQEKLVPLDEGLVAWPDVVKMLKQLNFDGPISLHSEYKGAHSFRDMNTQELIDQTRRDLDYLRPFLS